MTLRDRIIEALKLAGVTFVDIDGRIISMSDGLGRMIILTVEELNLLLDEG